MALLQVVIVSTRQGRKGPAVASWFEERARAHEAFDVELVDLKSVGLPLYDEPEHPRLRKYVHDTTRAWSAIVDRGDAFVFVTPEYNFATPPSLVNAHDHLLGEWQYKAAGFVSYGGVSGGLRGVQMAKQTLTSLNVMPIVPAVVLPNFASRIGPDGVFQSDDKTDAAAASVLTELARWEHALRTLRAPRA